MKRINWIDWVKAFCMTVVVFCHLPQQKDAFYVQYLGAVILSAFFFVSGYLKKPLATQKESLKKYGYSLLIPYIIYNVIYYPYWFSKFYIEHGGISLFDCLKPVTGTLLLQLNTNFSCELNGVTWFLPALFMMHWITDICNRKKHGKAIMLTITIITMILYGANKYYNFAPYLTFNGFTRCICFFLMGNLFQQAGYLRGINIKKDFAIGLSTLLLSIVLFYWHIHEDYFTFYITLYYLSNFLFVFGIIYLCRSINDIRFRIVTLFSIGTMLIFGIHRIIIGIIDFGFEKLLHIPDITYNWYETTLITIAIEIILIPLIIISKNRFPIILGKKSISR